MNHAHRSRTALLVLSGALIMAQACGGGAAAGEGAEEPTPPPPPLTAEALLPSEAFLVAEVDLERLRESSNWDVFEAILLTVEENVARVYPTTGNGELRRWLAATDAVWVGLTPAGGGGDSPDVFIVADGRLSTADAARALEGLGTNEPSIQRREPAEYPTFTGPEVLEEVVLLEDGLAVSATSGRVGEVVSRFTSRQGQSALSGEMRETAERVDFGRDAVNVAVVFTPEAKAYAAPIIDSRARALLDVSSSGALRIGVADGIDALAIVRTTDPRVAEAAVGELERQRASLAQSPVVHMLGMAFLLEGLGISSEGGDLRVSLRGGRDDARNLLGRASGFVGMAISAALAGSGER